MVGLDCNYFDTILHPLGLGSCHYHVMFCVLSCHVIASILNYSLFPVQSTLPSLVFALYELAV